MNSERNLQAGLTRRQFLRGSTAGVGLAALASLLGTGSQRMLGGIPVPSHRMPRARRVIWLTQAGAPSQLDRKSVV